MSAAAAAAAAAESAAKDAIISTVRCFVDEFKVKSAYPLSCICVWIALTVSFRRWSNNSS